SAVDVCKKLIQITPESQQHVFLSDSGSVAVEVALKMALQYWAAKSEPRSQFMTIRNGYHGDTFAAMSVTDPDNSMHSLYKGFLPQHIFADAPQCGFYDEWHEDDFAHFRQQMEKHHQQIAAVILEPIVQGAGGMRFYHPQYLKTVRNICDRYGILLICDEIATGFGRTGKLFACEHAGIEPDILCVGKALTGGYLSLAATLTSSHVATTMCGGEAGCFMHGPTFMGNPLACAVADASLGIIMQNQWQQQVLNIEQQLQQLLPPLMQLAAVKEVRALGAIGVVETHQAVDMERLQASFVASGVWIRPFGRLVYIMPPYIIQSHELQQLIAAIEKGLANA
ncbi:MAG: adenosylmethionine--8-amino-7-oxononanoate transaminase, partial [Porticoccaceae bacterium]|nr:adenosylmethionine--8-amino-7-oxononanoate transaminase [Porticoccaceae bacterium]